MKTFTLFIKTPMILIMIMFLSCGSGDESGLSGCSDNGPATSTTSDQTAVAVALLDAFPGLIFSSPVAVLQHPVDIQRWYVVELAGKVLTFTGQDATVADTFIDISDRVASGGEGGLLSMAFHPGFAANHTFFLSYTGPGTPLTSYISAFTALNDDAAADPDSERILLSLDQPFTNHNGGGIAFGPDGNLFIGFGDGGSGGDPQGNGQNPHTLLGTMLRIDVDNNDPLRGNPYAIPTDNPFADSPDCAADQGCPEIYAYGFRNPWRWSFDQDTGDLWVGDVGQGAWEEIDRVEVGLNYGWNIKEGDHCYNAAICDDTGLISPVTEYDHNSGNSVTGGYVYRGSDLPELVGDYVYGDFGSGRIWHILDADQGGTQVQPLIASQLNISSFGQDGDGEIYVVSYGDGHIYRLIPGDSATSQFTTKSAGTRPF